MYLPYDCFSEEDVIIVVREMIGGQTRSSFLVYDGVRMSKINCSAVRAAMSDARKLLVKTETAARSGAVSQLAALLGGPIAGFGVMAKRFIDANGLRKEFNFQDGSFRWACAVLFYLGYREIDSAIDNQISLLHTDDMKFPMSIGRWSVD